MPTLNPAGSAQRLLDVKTNQRGFCLTAVRYAVLQQLPVLKGATTAHDSWNKTPGVNRHTGKAPKDTVIYITGAQDDDWDVVLSLGDGINCVASDYAAHWGKTGIQTIASRCHQVGGAVEGWSDALLGYTFAGTTPAGLTPQGENMLTVNASFIVDPFNLVISPGFIKNAPLTQAETLATIQGSAVDVVTQEQLAELIWDMGLQEFLPNGEASVPDFLKTLNNGGFAIASWLKAAPATIDQAALQAALTAAGVVTAAELTAAIASIKIPTATVNLTPAQITTLSGQVTAALAKVIPTAAAISTAVVAGVKKIIVKTTLS